MKPDEEKQPLLAARGMTMLMRLRHWRLPALIFNDDGRIGRHTFWLYMLCVMILAFTLLLSRSLRQSGIAHVAFAILLLYPSYCIFAKRFQDFAIHGAWAALIVSISAVDAVFSAAGITVNSGRYHRLMQFWEWLSLTNTFICFGILGLWPPTDGQNAYGSRTPPW